MINDANGVIPNRIILNCHHPEILSEIEKNWPTELTPKRFSEKVYHYLFPEKTICDYGNHKTFESYNKGYFFCQKHCNCAKESRKKTMIERYGTEYPLQSETLKEKFKNTLVERYGVDNINAMTIEKRETTNLKKYGVKYPLQSNEILLKIEKTNVEKYGIKYPFQDKEIQEKIKQTILEKYGVSTVLVLEENQKKSKKVINEKYGSNSSFSSLEVQNKRKETLLKKYGVSHQSQIHIDPIKVNELNDETKFIEIYNSFERVSEIMKYFGVGETTIHQRAKKLGLPLKYNTISNEEAELVDFLSNYTIVEQSRRDIISPKEIDIWLPEYNIGIEYDGLYYHSTKNDRITPTYHLKKTENANCLGHRLIHIFSDEWIYKKDIVKSRLLNILNKTENIIYARNTKIRNLNNLQSKSFLEQNHIQGNCNSHHKYGLFYNDELVSVMTFGVPRFNKNYDWELLRFCNKTNFSVVGGASKLLNHFIKNHNSSIISYADRRWSDGNLYNQLGFVFLHNSTPNYYYIIGTKRESRNKYQKHKLKKLLPIYDSLLSEKINMENNGYYRIYDCGNSVWEYRNKEN
jgi:hypothetical protein